jgi:pimeloyl-ACP methyl ester carboxylesterase
VTCAASRLVARGAPPILLAVLLVAPGCAWMYPTVVPLRTLAYPAAAGRRADTLLVLLPGRGDQAASFADHGFVADVHASTLSVDVVAVDAHIGYYMKETIVERVWNDVLLPARQRGYRRIWIAGISMGGLGALAIARVHGDAIERLFLLGPYLGPADLMRQIAAAGGPARWTPNDPNDIYQKLWRWLKGYADPAAQRPALTLGFTTGDRLAPGHRLLSQILPPERVLEGDGGHDWKSWRKLWQRTWSSPPSGASGPRVSVPIENLQ